MSLVLILNPKKTQTNINSFSYSYIIYKLHRLVVNCVTVLSTNHDFLLLAKLDMKITASPLSH